MRPNGGSGMAGALPGITREQLAEVKARLLGHVRSTRETYEELHEQVEQARLAHVEAVRDAAAIASHTEIAREAGVSRQRIGQIIESEPGEA